MLKIEKLNLQGFKSFCDSTEVIFDQEGITAVVGPNGCGKSNVADGINWVIGQQSAKALRGGKMEDVIFQGTRTRQPSGMAEVILTMIVTESFEVRGQTQPEAEALKHAEESLNQAAIAVDAVAEAVSPTETAEPEPQLAEAQSAESGQAQASEETPTDMPFKRQRQFKKLPANAAPQRYEAGERITVGRRLYRTGESEYELNGRTCRLRDVQELFAGTGLGGAHYAIIEQGRIGQVLSAKPLDRRALIEEAAGISKFKMRQHSAELKLEASRTNLSRLTDIIAEIERQQNSLKRQAQRARRYQRFRQEMRDLMRAAFVVDYRVSTRTLGELDLALSEIASREVQLTSTIAEREMAEQDAAQAARLAEELLNETRQTAATTDLDAERAKQQQGYLNEQLQSLGTRSQQFARDQATIAERSAIIAQEISRLRNDLQRIETEINFESKTLADEEASHQQQQLRDAEAERRLEEARKKVVECVTALERWRQLQRQFTDSVDRSAARLNGLAAERERAQAQAQTANEQFASVSENLEVAAIKQQQVAAALAETTATLSDLRQSRETRQARLTSLSQDLTAAEQRLKSLAQLDERRSYFSEAVQALMKHAYSGGNGFKTLGTLADFVHVAPEHETMIETALRDELQYIVVPSFDDALRAIDFLKAEGAGRATFLVAGLDSLDPLPAVTTTEYSPRSSLADYSPFRYQTLVSQGTDYPGSQSRYQTLDSVLGLRPEIAAVFKLAMPGLAKASVIETPQFVAQEAHTANGSGPHITLTRSGERIVAGQLVTGGSASEKGLGVLALKREMGELIVRVESLANDVRAAETDLNEIKAHIAELEETQRQLDNDSRQIEKQLAVQREQLQQCQRERERTATHIRVIEQETQQTEAEQGEFESKLTHAASQTAEADEARAEAEAVVTTLQTEMTDLRRNAEHRAQDLSRRRADFAAKTERRRGLQNDIRRLDNEAADLDGRINRNRLEQLDTEEQTGVAKTTLTGTTESLQRLLAGQRQMAYELEQRTARLAATRERLDQLDQELRAIRNELSQTREARSQREIEKAKLSSNLEHLIATCHAELGENIADVCQRLEASKAMAESEMQFQPFPAPRRVQTESPESSENPKSEDASELDENEEGMDAEPEITFWQVPEDFDLEAAKMRLDELRQKIDAIGPVNMMALEELTEVEERYIFLTGQKADIEKAIADTVAAIAEIKKRSREKFVDAFHSINENFKQMFVELFGGGQGEMRLIDESDVLESGIEIIAQPPGKRLQNVLLLSGGEKAMSAMALVLGIFKYRPSPFCLLDEVDAPLDEVNIGRFAGKVIEMSANTQFMIITHSKRTMEIARTLYGVTMEDPGVSKLISVKLT